VSAWRPRLPWLLLVALVIAVVALALDYTQTLKYNLAWTASYVASSAPVRYVSYGLSPSSSWALSLMPWYTKTYSLPWKAAWSLSLMPVSTTQSQILWYAQWSAWPVIVYNYPGDKTVTVEPEASVSVKPPGGVWTGIIDLTGYGRVYLSLPAGVELVPLGGLTFNGTNVYVGGSGRLLQRVNCYLISVANAQGQAVATSAVFNETKLSVGTSMKCLIGARYNVEVPGYKVANIKVNNQRFYLPFMPKFLNTTDYYLNVVVADPTVVTITKVTAKPTAAGYVQVTVYGYVYDNMTSYRIPSGQVTLYYNGVPYDVAVTGSDGSFILVMTERLSGTIKLSVGFTHPDYQASSADVEYNVVPSGTGTAPGAELPSPLEFALIIASVLVIVFAVIMAKKMRARAIVTVNNKEWFE